MKKNLLSIAVVSAIILTTLAGCGKDKTSTENTTTTNVEAETDKSTEVDLCSDNVNITGNLGGAVSVEVKTVDEAATEYKAVEEYLKDTNSVFEMYDIKISDKNGNDIKLSNSVKVSIKISEKLAQASGDAYVIFYSEDDSFTKIAASEENGVVSFMTSHFSIYTVVKYDSKNEAAVEKIEAVTEENVEPSTEETNSEAITDQPTSTGEPVTDQTTSVTYTYEEANQTMWATGAVNVRDLPCTDGNVIGSLKKNGEVKVTGICRETGWYRIFYNSGEAYVSNNYLSMHSPVEKEDETTKEQPTTTEPSTEPTKPVSNVPSDYSKTAMYDYNDARVQRYISEGTPYPTVDYSTVPVVDVDSMVAPEKMGPNCSGLSNLSTPYNYDYDPINVDTLPYFTWNEEIPLNQYIIWGDKLGFFFRSDDRATRDRLCTTDFKVAFEEGKSYDIQFGNWTDWSEEGYWYYFSYITDWK